MHPIRKQRLILLTLMVMGVGIAIALTLYALRQNINLFYTPTQVIAGQAPVGRELRVGGLVQKGSVKREPNSLKVNFVLTDMAKEIIVHYTGILPDLFREGQGIIAQGHLLPNGTIKAREILAKHDEKYMPPQVEKALRHDS